MVAQAKQWGTPFTPETARIHAMKSVEARRRNAVVQRPKPRKSTSVEAKAALLRRMQKKCAVLACMSCIPSEVVALVRAYREAFDAESILIGRNVKVSKKVSKVEMPSLPSVEPLNIEPAVRPDVPRPDAPVTADPSPESTPTAPASPS